MVFHGIVVWDKSMTAKCGQRAYDSVTVVSSRTIEHLGSHQLSFCEQLGNHGNFGAEYGHWRDNEQEHLSGPQPRDGRKMQKPELK